MSYLVTNFLHPWPAEIYKADFGWKEYLFAAYKFL